MAAGRQRRRIRRGLPSSGTVSPKRSERAGAALSDGVGGHIAGAGEIGDCRRVAARRGSAEIDAARGRAGVSADGGCGSLERARFEAR